MRSLDDSDESLSLFKPNSYWYKAILFLIFALAILIRFKNIQAPGLLVEREYTSAIFARAYYYQGNAHITSWLQTVAVTAKDQQPVLEPPITEFLVSLIYRFVNQEEIWYARYLTNIFWLIGGIFMYKITRFLLSVESAIVATSYYLFVPMGIMISRSFQPDALMMMLFLISLYSMLTYSERPTTSRLLLSASLTGITLLVRPLVLFALFFAYVAIAVYKNWGFGRFVDRSFIIFWSIAFLIPFAYYGYGIFFADFLRWKVTSSFRPHLFLTRQYWQTWFELGVSMAGPSFIISALIGFFSMHKSLVKALVVGLTVGYVIFGLVFNYHVITHGYYHIQLFLIIGICAAPFFVMVLRMLKKALDQSWWLPAAAIFLFCLYFSYSTVKNSLYKAKFEDPSIAREIGEIVHHSTRTVFIAYHYGVPLEYYGEFAGGPWPVRIDDSYYRPINEKERTVRERLDSFGFQPEYFVITDFDLYKRQHQDLETYLDGYCSVISQKEKFLIYGSCARLGTHRVPSRIRVVSSDGDS